MKYLLKNLTYRKAKSHDVDLALELLKITAQDLQERGIDQWNYWLDPPQERLDWLREGFENDEFNFFFKNNTLVAMYRLMNMDLKYWGTQEEKAFYIHSLVVHPNLKGHHIGNQILMEIQKLAASSEIKILRLDCDSTNQRLCRYYEDYGFKKARQKQMPNSLNNLYELQLK